LLEDGVLIADERGHLVAAATPSVRGAHASLTRSAAESKASDEVILAGHKEIASHPSTTQQKDAALLRMLAMTTDPVADFLSRPHPRALKGPWLAGWALDFHSRYDGDVASRSIVGQLVFRYKYGNEQQLAQDLAGRWAELLTAHPGLSQFDAVIPVPPSTHRDLDPVSNLAQVLATHMKVPVLVNVLIKTRVTQPQKEMKSLAQKRANVAGAFALRGEVRGKHIILIDDLYDSGATLEEAARVLARGGVSEIVVLTLTKTIHSDA
jgi:Phosphoribosyl transferase domain